MSLSPRGHILIYSCDLQIKIPLFAHRQYQSLFLDFVSTLFPKENLDLYKAILDIGENLDLIGSGGHSYKTYFIGEEKSITLLESDSNVDEEHGTTGTVGDVLEREEGPKSIPPLQLQIGHFREMRQI